MIKKANFLKKYIVMMVSCAAIANCASTRYMDVKDSSGSRQWGPREIKTTVSTMVGSLYGYLKTSNNPAYLDVSKIRNRTSEHIDTNMLANEITTNLIRKQIKFIDRTMREEAIKEIEAGQTGLIDSDSAIPMGELKSPNYLLKGDIIDNVRYVDGDRVQYLVVTLKLIHVASSEVRWQEQQEFLKASAEERLTW
ncbi:MAG: penicillin-binding protein activator LpoB [Spirochaetia bacterium]|nr:penicillin-binding protein activator LpoB [Spirochaetia bacterium]